MPALSEIFVARPGHEAVLNGKTIKTSGKRKLADSILYINEGEKLFAAGLVDAVVDLDLKPFDFLPSMGLIEAANGVITGWNQNADPGDLMPVNFISPADGEPFEVINPTGKSQVVLVCEHASNRIPKKLNDLGLSKDQLQTHVAWDPGALELAKALSHSLDAQMLSAERATRAHEIYVPFHQQLDNLLSAKRAAGVEPIVITIHSFTPVFHGKRRNVELGFLHAQQRQMADDLLQFSSGRSELSICLLLCGAISDTLSNLSLSQNS